MVKRGPFLTPHRVVSSLFGDPRLAIASLRGLPLYLRNMRTYRRGQRDVPDSLRLDWLRVYPCLRDRYDSAGVASGHYFHQDVWAARRIHTAAPSMHVDVGSRVDGFVAHLLSFREVYVVDIRPLSSSDPDLHFVRADMRRLPYEDLSLPSLSSLHAAEHVGLGRYDDPVDPAGCFTAMSELQRVLAPRGRLYFSVPIGRERLEFDAHRVFSPQTVVAAFDELRLIEFSAVDDTGMYVERTEPERFRSADYACGLFLFERPGKRSAQASASGGEKS